MPELLVFEHEGNTYRLVLHAKRGLRGWKEEPVTALEQHRGKDLLGIDTWVPVQSEPINSWLTSFYMAMRPRLKP